MPPKREREYYRMGFLDGLRAAKGDIGFDTGRALERISEREEEVRYIASLPQKRKPKRKLSAWNKYVKANSNKPRFRYARSNKINLKKMAVAFRKTPAGRKKKRR